MTRLLVTGATGILGGYLVREALRAGHDVVRWSRLGAEGADGVPLEDAAGLDAAFARARVDVVLHAAAIASVATCASEPSRARLVNADASGRLAELAARTGARFVLVSTDLVFDGTAAPYDESAVCGPLSTYGHTKVEAERAVARHGACVARLPLLFGPSLGATRGFFDAQIEALREARAITGFVDEVRTPLSLFAASRALLALANERVTGVVHLPGPERMTRHALAQRLGAVLGASSALVREGSRLEVPGEPRPFDTSLATSRAPRSVQEALALPFEAACAAMDVR